MTKYDLIIIGAGPGGYETAVEAAKRGLQVLVIESDKIGGTCLNRGCIPTKCLCRNADAIREIRKSATFGINADNISFDITKAIERKDNVVEQLRNGIDTLLNNPCIKKIEGKAIFTNPHSVKVGNDEFTAPYIIIATGSITKYLPIEGAHSEHVITSTELLNTNTIPKRLCIIGGGVIGIEFASIFNTFGSQVTVVEYCKEILPNFDSDIAKRLRLSLKSQGITIINNAEVKSIDGNRVKYEQKETIQTTEADVIMMAVGRTANTASLNLSDIGITYDRHGINTDKNFKTNIDGIFAIGDINGKCQLAHAATFQGKHVINIITGKKDNIRFDIMPAAVFSYPEAATVGVTSDYCKANSITTKTYKNFYRANGKALAMDETEGLIKITCDEDDNIIGAQILGAHASDLIHEITVLMNNNAHMEDLSAIIHAHPTLSEII